MRITSLLSSAHADESISFSVEVFAPDEDGVEPLRARLGRVARMEPLFVDVVGAGGLASARVALALAVHARRVDGLVASLHLAASDLSRDEARAVLDEARAGGVCNLVLEQGVGSGSGLGSAADFVSLARSAHGDHFCIGVVGFPRGPVPGAGGSFEAALGALCACAGAGADFVLAQHTFGAAPLVDFVASAASAGLRLPIVPSVALPGSWAAYTVLADATGERLPPEDEARLRALADEPDAFRGAAVAAAAELCRALLASGAASGLHFVTLNLEGALRGVLGELGLGGSARRKLPWRPAADESRAGEDVRPIFWGNRAASYVDRTAGWAHYPSGRWGSGARPSGTAVPAGGSGAGAGTSAPAPAGGSGEAPPPSDGPDSGGRVFGVLDAGQLHAAAGTVEERRAMWGASPKTPRDVWAVFARYVEGGRGVPRLPWCDAGSLLPETGTIARQLAALNAAGFLTINSQPRVDAARSDDATFGWGGAGGRVYQKAYVECFCPPGHLAALMEAAAAPPGPGRAHRAITFHAVNAAGKWHTNSLVRGGVNAVTWGVFPDREVLQPTVMDPESFVGPWREEAFGLWTGQWADIYEEGSDAHSLVCDIAETYFLVSAVDNDYAGAGDDALFGLFEDALGVLKAKGARDPQAVAAVLQQQRAARGAAAARGAKALAAAASSGGMSGGSGGKTPSG